jgi:hypothetical protein
MFSFFNYDSPVSDTSRFSSCSLLKGLFEILAELRLQVNKLKTKAESDTENTENIAALKYAELTNLLNKIEQAIIDFNSVPENAQNELQDVKLLIEAILSATKEVKIEVLKTQRSISSDDVKISGVSLMSLAPLAFYSVGAMSGVVALAAGSVLMLGAGSRAVNRSESKTRSVDIILKLQEFSTSLLSKVDETLDVMQKSMLSM